MPLRYGWTFNRPRSLSDVRHWLYALGSVREPFVAYSEAGPPAEPLFTVLVRPIRGRVTHSPQTPDRAEKLRSSEDIRLGAYKMVKGVPRLISWGRNCFAAQMREFPQPYGGPVSGQ